MSQNEKDQEAYLISFFSKNTLSLLKNGSGIFSNSFFSKVGISSQLNLFKI